MPIRYPMVWNIVRLYAFLYQGSYPLARYLLHLNLCKCFIDGRTHFFTITCNNKQQNAMIKLTWRVPEPPACYYRLVHSSALDTCQPGLWAALNIPEASTAVTAACLHWWRLRLPRRWTENEQRVSCTRCMDLSWSALTWTLLQLGQAAEQPRRHLRRGRELR